MRLRLNPIAIKMLNLLGLSILILDGSCRTFNRKLNHLQTTPQQEESRTAVAPVRRAGYKNFRIT